MPRTILTYSEAETQLQGAELATELFSSQNRPVFVQLKGDLGAGKTAFARGFIKKWSELSQDTAPEQVTSPTFNIVRVYGTKSPIAHLDLYRLKSIEELEQIGFEHYFFELAACLVEWLEQIPEALSLPPPHSVVVEIKILVSDPKARQLQFLPTSID